VPGPAEVPKSSNAMVERLLLRFFLLVFGLLAVTVLMMNQISLDQNKTALYSIDSYFVSPDDPRNGPLKVPVDLLPDEKRWAELVAQSNQELNDSPYDWGPSWPADSSESFWEEPFARPKHNIWPNSAYKSNLDKAVDKSLRQTMAEVDKELQPPNQLKLPVRNWMEG
jgi:hypothetical protein